jgi:hypothetical protein
MAKLKSHRDVTMALQHNTRERMPSNADPSKTAKNLVYGGSAAESLVRFDGLMPDKIRSNAVQCVELVFTASPDFNGDWGGYLRSALDWGLETFGIDPKQKDIRPAISYAVHHDETTPHLHLLVVPLKDGKLNAKHFIGGSRDRMAELQEDFYQKVGKKFDLERGRSAAETRSRHSHHTLAGKTAELEKKDQQLREFADSYKKLQGVSPNAVQAFRRMTPDQLRGFAAVIEGKGFKTVEEYANAQDQQQRQQHTIKR